MSGFDFTKPALAAKDTTKAEATRLIKKWVSKLDWVAPECVIHVAELQCHEPDCPDYETVITLMDSQTQQNRTLKIFKPLSSVTEEEITSAMQQSFTLGKTAVAEIKALLRKERHC